MKMLNRELENISRTIDQIIGDDSFPDTIQPNFLQEAVRAYPSTGGKRLRPALTMWSCGLLGGDPDIAKYIAASVEIYHNWTLVHDDIIDNDNIRRGKPTTHNSVSQQAEKLFGINRAQAEKFGKDIALLAGDVQQGWAIDMLLKSSTGVGSNLTLALLGRMQTLVNRELISGEALDVEFTLRNYNTLDIAMVESMLYMKTGALLRFCAEAGAAVALETSDFDTQQVSQLGDFASSSGIAFQLRDDWLGIFGNKETFGKRVCSDLAEGKPTILLLKSLEGLNVGDRDELLQLMGRDSYSCTEIERAQHLITKSGAEKFVLEKAEHLALDAKKALDSYENNRYRELLLELVDYLIDRHV